MRIVRISSTQFSNVSMRQGQIMLIGHGEVSEVADIDAKDRQFESQWRN